MKAFELRDAFGFDNLHIVEREPSKLENNSVRVKMRAVSLNYRDILMVKGLYNPKQPLPLIPLSDGVGTVVALGPRVTRVMEGDRVALTFAQAWVSGPPTRAKLASTLGGPLDGTLTEEMVVSEEGLVHLPNHLTDEEASTLPCAALTAWNALFPPDGSTGARPGDTILIQGTGGVSLFALQFASLIGATVIITSSSDEKLERARALGAKFCINYASCPDWDKAAREITGGVGVDHVIEVGGAGTLERSLRAVRVGGVISLIGVLSGSAPKLNLLPIVMRNIRVQGIIVGHRESFDAMNRAIGASGLRPVIDRVFPFEDAKEAFPHLASGAHFGKVSVRF